MGLETNNNQKMTKKLKNFTKNICIVFNKNSKEDIYMSVVKEYKNNNTMIRIHDDYINTDEKNKAREIIISLMINFLKNNNE